MKKNRKTIEKEIFSQMTKIYCKHKEHNKELCNHCKEIIGYAHVRIDSCRFGNEKTFCSKCTVHCFKPEMREDVKRIMRYSGPRILFYHPIMVLKHVISK